MVPPDGVFLNSPIEVDELFNALAEFEDLLRPYRLELEELGL